MPVTAPCIGELRCSFVNDFVPVNVFLAALASQRGGWHFGANDNTIGGWMVTAFYAILGCLCWFKVAMGRLTAAAAAENQTLPPFFWLGLATGITLLGVNKQLDFQAWLIEVGWGAAVSAGVAEHARLIEAAFAAVGSVAVLFLSGVLWKLARRATKQERMALAGTAAILGFVLVRMADILHADEALGIRINQHRPLVVTELGILIFLCFAVWKNSRSV